jgi:thymidylate kinase
MKICIDGNDGTGKTTLIAHLRKKYPNLEIQDRGLPTQLTIGKDAEPADLYIILSCKPEISQERLRLSGKSLDEYYHQYDNLVSFHKAFLELATARGWTIIDASQRPEQVLAEVGSILQEWLDNFKE